MPSRGGGPDIGVLPLGDHSPPSLSGTVAVGSILFQSIFALPKIFDERLQGLAVQFSGLESLCGNEDGVATVIGSLAFVVFAVASFRRPGRQHVGQVRAAERLHGRRRHPDVFFAIMPGLTDGYALAVGSASCWEPLVKSQSTIT